MSLLGVDDRSTTHRGKTKRRSQGSSSQLANYLHNKLPDNLPLLVAFEAEVTPHPETFFKASTRKGLEANVWWKGLKSSAIPKNFLQLMMQLHNAPCSSASIERVFSSFGLVQSKLRNRLGVERATKLVFCYRMLRGNQDLHDDGWIKYL
jgi:hypothetical protein